MPQSPPVYFFLADERTPLRPGDRRWNTPLPADRQAAVARHSGPAPSHTIRYGDYFTAAAAFLCRRRFHPLAAAAAQVAGRPVHPDHIREIRIFLEKHGAFYHPARVVLRLPDAAVSLVLNVALTEAGRRCLQTDYALLQRLGRRHLRWLPSVALIGSGKTEQGVDLPMFLAQWFEGFCEFHLTGDGSRTVIWDPEGGPRPVAAWQRREIYRGVARILGDYYQLETGARIHPWHHGAGDFIALLKEGGVQLRLVTVRGYPGAGEGGRSEWILRTLLAAFLHLSVRTRIDRADGTGDLLWADPAVVEPTLIGFVESLADKPPIPGYSEPLPTLFLTLLDTAPERTLHPLAEETLSDFDPGSAEIDFARCSLSGHIHDLKTAVRGLSSALAAPTSERPPNKSE